MPDERGLRRPGHDQIPSHDSVSQQRAAFTGQDFPPPAFTPGITSSLAADDLRTKIADFIDDDAGMLWPRCGLRFEGRSAFTNSAAASTWWKAR